MDQIIFGNKTISNITLDDVIYLYLMDKVGKIPLLDEYFDNGHRSQGYIEEIMLKKVPEKNCSLLVLVRCRMDTWKKSLLPIKILTKLRPLIFHPEFLSECWQKACEFNLEHHSFGNVIKKLGYKTQVNTKKFDNYYFLNADQRKKNIDELTIDDIIYLFTNTEPLNKIKSGDINYRSLYTQNVYMHTIFEHCFEVKGYKKDDFDKIALVNCAHAVTNNWSYCSFDFGFSFSGKYCSYYVSQEFLQQLWVRVCEFGMEHHRVGTAIKQLRYELQIDKSKFLDYYNKLYIV